MLNNNPLRPAIFDRVYILPDAKLPPEHSKYLGTEGTRTLNTGLDLSRIRVQADDGVVLLVAITEVERVVLR